MSPIGTTPTSRRVSLLDDFRAKADIVPPAGRTPIELNLADRPQSVMEGLGWSRNRSGGDRVESWSILNRTSIRIDF